MGLLPGVDYGSSSPTDDVNMNYNGKISATLRLQQISPWERGAKKFT